MLIRKVEAILCWKGIFETISFRCTHVDIDVENPITSNLKFNALRSILPIFHSIKHNLLQQL